MTLPSGYQEVEYIKSTGTQYIDTQVIPKTTTKVVSKVMVESFTSTQQGTGIWWVWYNYNSNWRFNLWYRNGSWYWFWYWSNNWQNYCVNVSLWQIAEIENYISNWTAYSIVNWTTQTYTWASFTQYTWTIYLFKRNVWSSSETAQANIRIYNFKLYDNWTLVRDLVPCYRKSDSVIWMYDLVNDTFYTNSWTWTFEKWPDVVPVPTYKLHWAIQTFHYQFEVPYSWEPDASRTLIYYPLTSNLVDQMWNGNTGTAHWNVTFNATDGATSWCYVNWPSSIYVTWMSLWINSKTTCTMNVWVNFVNKTDHWNIIGYNSNYNYSQPFKIYCATTNDINFQVSYGTSSSNQWAVYIKSDFIKQLNSWFHNYGFTINNWLVKLYVDWQLASDEVNIWAVASWQSEMQIWYWWVYWTWRLAWWYARDYIVESIVWSDDDFAKYYNRSKSKVWL